MARNDNWNGIRAISQAHRPAGVCVADSPGQLCIRNGLAVGNIAKFTPYLFLKRSAFWRKVKIESFKFSSKIRLELKDGLLKIRRIVPPFLRWLRSLSVLGEANVPKPARVSCDE